jgi:hypothetical protein
MPQKDLLPPVDIPDLSTLHAQAEWAAVIRSIGGGGSADQVAYTLQVNCIRLLDAAIRDYSLGRHAILQFHACKPNQFGIGYILQATTHFEGCIWHLERFIKHMRALRSLRSAEMELKTLIPAGLSFLQNSSERQIAQLRHTLAHLEGTALRGELLQGTTIALLPLKDGLCIADHTLEWQDLVHWLRDAHSCVERMARFKSSPTAEV